MHVAQVFGAPSNTRGKEVLQGAFLARENVLNEEAPGGGGITGGQVGERRIAGQEDRSPGTEPSGRRLERLAMTVRDTDMQVLWLGHGDLPPWLGMQQVVLGWVGAGPDALGSHGRAPSLPFVRHPTSWWAFCRSTLTDRCDRRSLMRTRRVWHGRGSQMVVAWLAYLSSSRCASLAGHRRPGHVAGPWR